MTTFAVDSENNIVAQAGTPSTADNQQSFATEKELAKVAAEWPAPDGVWNGFAGVTPFDGLKPVKKFTKRQTAVRRIWQAVACLVPTIALQAQPVAPTDGEAKKAPPV
jgi:hypothetical protein